MFGTKLTTKLAMFFAIAAIVCLPALSQSTAPKSTPAPGHIHTTAVPTARVIAKVDNSLRTTLPGHLPAALSKAKDMGRIASSTSAQHLVMVLKSSDQQKSELRRVLDEQQDSNSNNYHQWLTPDQFGATFGVADADIAQVSAWLQSQGFTVESVSKGKRVLYFSGTTGNLETAFQTEIHTYQVNGETHVSNNSAIKVPTALSPVIAGVTLDNFFRKANMGPTSVVSGPELTNGSSHFVGPADFATIYNTTPLLASGINGTGVTIAVVGRSDILLSDVQSYRQMFNLPNNDPVFIHAGQDNGVEPGDDGESDLDVEISGGIAPKAQIYFVIGTPTYFIDGISQSVQYIVENNLADIMSISYNLCEYSSGMGGNEFNSQAFEQAAAQGISVFVSSGDNGPAGCDGSNSNYEVNGYAVGGDASTPYNVAVGGSEFYENGGTYWGASAPLFLGSALSYIPETPWNEARGVDKGSSASGSGLWSGSGGISAFYLKPAWQHGPGVPTIDPDLTQPQYGGQWVTDWFITTPGSGYTTAPNVTFSGGGCAVEPVATSVLTADAVGALSFTYLGIGCTSAPTVVLDPPAAGTQAVATVTVGAMQSPPPLISGVPHRYLPDLSLNAASGHDGTVYCSEGVCRLSSTGTWQGLGLVGGTSVAAPSMAGLQALINQANGGRQGAPNYIYYTLAAAENTTGCNSSLPPATGSNCAFQDITYGDNLVCGTSTCSATTGTKIGFQAGIGYDLATGLGSVNAANLSSQWSSVHFNSSHTTLNLSATSGLNQGDSVTFNGTVASVSGIPTGDVAFILSHGVFGNTVDVMTGTWSTPGPYATLDSGGNYSATFSNLPAGTYTITARYAGDENFGSSLSTPVTITVNQGNSQVVITPEWFDDTSSCSPSVVSSYTYGQFAWIPATVSSTVSGANGNSVPTGTVTFTVDGTPYATETLDPQGNGYLAAGSVATNSCIHNYMFAQSPTLTGGVHTIGATYSGDSTFSPATATPVTVTVNQLPTTGSFTPGAAYINSGDPLTLTMNLTAPTLTGSSAGSQGETGTMTITDNTTATVLGTFAVVSSATVNGANYYYGANAALTTTGITTAGAHNIQLGYSGDANYTPAFGSMTVNVGSVPATTTTVTSSSNPTGLNGRPIFTATVTGTPAVTSGTVYFYDSFSGFPVVLGGSTVGAGGSTTFQATTGTAFWAGTHPITAVFIGSATNAASTSAAYNETVNQGTTTLYLTAKTEGTLTQTYTFALRLSPSQSNVNFGPRQGVASFYDGATLIGTAVPNYESSYGYWLATFSTNSLAFGTHTITAKYSDINYALSTSNAQTIFVGGTPTVTWAAPAAITYPAPLTAAQLNATANLPGTFVYTPALGTVLNAGNQTLSVTYTPADSTDFAPQIKTVLIPVSQATQTISFTVASPVPYSAGLTIPLVATGGASGNPVTFSVLSGPGYLTGSVLNVTAAGSIVIAADQAGNTNYSSAPEVIQTLVVNQITQTITFTPLTSPVTFGVAPITLSATGGASGNPVTFTLISGPGILTGDVLTVTGAGTIVVAADQKGSVNYSAAPEVTQTLIVNQATQAINFPVITPVTYKPNMSIILSASDVNAANSGNSIIFSVASGPGTIIGNVLTVTGAGSITINANQAGNTNYSAAPQVSITLLVNQSPQAISFFLPVASPITYTAGQTYNLLATGGLSGNPVLFSLTGPATLSGTNNSVMTITGAGLITVYANQAGNTNYLDAPTITRQLLVNPAAQSITFTVSSPIVYYGSHPNQTITLSATDAYTPYSNSPIVFSVVSGPGVVSGVNGATLTVTDAGSIVIAANQAAGPDIGGDPVGYSAAPTVYQTIVVTQAPQAIVNTTITGPVTYGVAPITLAANDAAYNGSLLNNSGNPIVFTVVSGPGTISGNKLTITAAGQIILVANQAGNGDYLAASQISQTLIVNQATPGVSLTSSLNPVFVSNPVTLTAVVSAPVNTMLTPSGWVTFLNGTTPIGTSLLVPGTGTATATLITSSLPFGTDAITATYTADTNYTVASSTTLSQKVGDFSISSSTAPQTVVPGTLAVYTFTVAPLAPATTFPTAVTLTVNGLPVGATYTLTVGTTTTNTIAAGASGAQTVTLSVQTPNTSIASNLQPQANTTLAQSGVNNSGSRLPAQRSPASKLPALAFALLLLPLAGRVRRTGKKLSRILPLLLLLLAGIAAATGLSGCGGTPSGSFGQAPANYTIQVTGTSINLIHSTSVTLTIE